MSADLSAIREQYGVTKKEAAILAVLLDGKTHSKADLKKSALKGQHACEHLIPQHIYRMRPKLRPLGIVIDSVGKRGADFIGWKLFNHRAAA